MLFYLTLLVSGSVLLLGQASPQGQGSPQCRKNGKSWAWVGEGQVLQHSVFPGLAGMAQAVPVFLKGVRIQSNNSRATAKLCDHPLRLPEFSGDQSRDRSIPASSCCWQPTKPIPSFLGHCSEVPRCQKPLPRQRRLLDDLLLEDFAPLYDGNARHDQPGSLPR